MDSYLSLVLFMAKDHLEDHITSSPKRVCRYVAGFSRQVEKMSFDPETLFIGIKQEDVLLASWSAANHVGELQYYC